MKKLLIGMMVLVVAVLAASTVYAERFEAEDYTLYDLVAGCGPGAPKYWHSGDTQRWQLDDSWKFSNGLGILFSGTGYYCTTGGPHYLSVTGLLPNAKYDIAIGGPWGGTVFPMSGYVIWVNVGYGPHTLGPGVGVEPLDGRNEYYYPQVPSFVWTDGSGTFTMTFGTTYNYGFLDYVDLSLNQDWVADNLTTAQNCISDLETSANALGLSVVDCAVQGTNALVAPGQLRAQQGLENNPNAVKVIVP